MRHGDPHLLRHVSDPWSPRAHDGKEGLAHGVLVAIDFLVGLERPLVRAPGPPEVAHEAVERIRGSLSHGARPPANCSRPRRAPRQLGRRLAGAPTKLLAYAANGSLQLQPH